MLSLSPEKMILILTDLKTDAFNIVMVTPGLLSPIIILLLMLFIILLFYECGTQN